MVPLFIKGALEHKVPLNWAARLMAENPAKHFRLDAKKGALTPGRDADIAVLVKRDTVYDAAASGNNVVGWSPYNGLTLPYVVEGTWLRGEKIFEAGNVLAEPGNGRFLRPEVKR
jgi:allantoinase